MLQLLYLVRLPLKDFTMLGSNYKLMSTVILTVIWIEYQSSNSQESDR